MKIRPAQNPGGVGMNVVMDERIEEFFEWLASQLFEGDFDWLESVYVYPMSVFAAGEIHVEKTPRDTAAFLTMRRQQLADLGIIGMTVDVMQVRRRPKSDRYSVWVEYVMLLKDGSEFGRSKVHYKCHSGEDAAIRIESLEIVETALPYAPDIKTAQRH